MAAINSWEHMTANSNGKFSSEYSRTAYHRIILSKQIIRLGWDLGGTEIAFVGREEVTGRKRKATKVTMRFSV